MPGASPCFLRAAILPGGDSGAAVLIPRSLRHYLYAARAQEGESVRTAALLDRRLSSRPRRNLQKLGLRQRSNFQRQQRSRQRLHGCNLLITSHKIFF